MRWCILLWFGIRYRYHMGRVRRHWGNHMIYPMPVSLHFTKTIIYFLGKTLLADARIFQLGQCNDCWCSSFLIDRSCFPNCPRYFLLYYVIWVQLERCNWKICIKLWCFGIRLCFATCLLRQHRRIVHCTPLALFLESISRWRLLTTHKHYITNIMKQPKIKKYQV